jgi:hypothetical protein
MKVHISSADSKDMEDPDYEATAELPNCHTVLQHYMCVRSKDMEGLDYEATAIH